MNMQSSAMPESFQPQVVAPVVMPETRPFYWSLRRELWENRFVYIAPLAVASTFLVGFVISLARMQRTVRAAELLDAMGYREAIDGPYDFAAALMMGTGILVSVFYCSDALQGERRDRSILFWKSLPVSDWTAVLAKASIPFLIVPTICFLAAIATQIVMLVLSSMVLGASGLSVGRYWSELSVMQMWLMLAYHIATAHAIWPAPVYAWLLLVSGWARRAALLWAAVPVMAIAALEGTVFRTTHFFGLVGSRLIGAAPASVMESTEMPTSPMTHITPGHFLISPGLWIGLAVTAAFLAGAVYFRRHRGPI